MQDSLLIHLLSSGDSDHTWWMIGDGAPRKIEHILSRDTIVACIGETFVAINCRAYVDWDIPNTALRVYRNGTPTTVRTTGVGDPYVRLRESGEFVFQEYLPGRIRRLMALDLQSLKERLLCEFPTANLPSVISEEGFCFASYDDATEQRAVHHFDAASGGVRELYRVPMFDQVTHFALSSSAQAFVAGLRQDVEGETRQVAYLLNAESQVDVTVGLIVNGTAASFSKDERFVALTVAGKEGPRAVVISAVDGTIVTSQELGPYAEWGEFSLPSCVWSTRSCYCCARRDDRHRVVAWSIEKDEWREVFEIDGTISGLLPTE